jgi:hypothetical protein
MAVFPITRNATQSRAWCVLGGWGGVGGGEVEWVFGEQAGRQGCQPRGEKIRPRKARKTGKLEGQAERNEEEFLPGIPEQWEQLAM